ERSERAFREHGKAHVQRRVRHLLVRAGHLMLGERGAAAGAPWHRAMPAYQPALLVAELQDAPDVRDVVVAVRVIGVVPVHPLAEADRLLRDRRGAPVDAGAARTREPVDPVRLDVALAVQVQLPLDLHLDPEALAVEAVLVALVESLHRLVALVEVLVGASPGVVNAHGLDVRGDRSIDERVARSAGVLLPQRVEGPLALPQVEHAVLELGEIEARPHRRESRLARTLVVARAPDFAPRE